MCDLKPLIVGGDNLDYFTSWFMLLYVILINRSLLHNDVFSVFKF